MSKTSIFRLEFCEKANKVARNQANEGLQNKIRHVTSEYSLGGTKQKTKRIFESQRESKAYRDFDAIVMEDEGGISAGELADRHGLRLQASSRIRL